MSTLFAQFFDKINQISPLESNFTEVLNSIALKPKILYFYGKMPENMSKNAPESVSEMPEYIAKDVPKNIIKSAAKIAPEKHRKTVAIVGARHNTRYGEEVAYKLAYELAKQGVVVVSGLAYGIDSIAHRGCLDAGGTTVAVLGTPITQIYPRAHTRLAAEIIEKGGAVISEYAPKDDQAAPLAPGEYFSEQRERKVTPKAAFLYRNRLIAGLADATIVVEAAVRSGSLNTATHALEQGKEVFAVPGNITNPYSQGCNKLIAQGAYPYTEPDDVLRVLFPEEYTIKCRKMKKERLVGDTDAETALLKAMSAGARKGDDIMKISLLPPEVFNQTITLLEIKSRVRALGANSWALI